MKPTVTITLHRHKDVDKLSTEHLNAWISKLSDPTVLQTTCELHAGELQYQPGAFCCLGVYAHYIDNIKLQAITGHSDLSEILETADLAHLSLEQINILTNSTYMKYGLDDIYLAEMSINDIHCEQRKILGLKRQDNGNTIRFKAASLNDSTVIYLYTGKSSVECAHRVRIQLTFKELAELLAQGQFTKDFELGEPKSLPNILTK